MTCAHVKAGMLARTAAGIGSVGSARDACSPAKTRVVCSISPHVAATSGHDLLVL